MFRGRCGRLYVIRGKQRRKARFQTGPAPSRFSPRKSHHTASKFSTRQADGLRFLLATFTWKFIKKSKHEPPKNNEKSSHRSSNHPRLDFRASFGFPCTFSYNFETTNGHTVCVGPLWLRLYTGVSLLSIVCWLVLACCLNLVIVELVMHTIDISNCLSYLKDYKF